MNDNSTNPVTLAREVLEAEERHDGTPAHEADLREERWEFYEDLCTSNAPTLASTVIDQAEAIKRVTNVWRKWHLVFNRAVDEDSQRMAELFSDDLHDALKGGAR